MIRLPPTSIALSEADIEFHLRQAQLYHGLRKQGFKKEDIARYLSDYHEQSTQAVCQGVQPFNLNFPSTVELACSRHRPSNSASEEHKSSSSKERSSPYTLASSTKFSATPFPDLPPDTIHEPANRQHFEPDVDIDDSVSPIGRASAASLHQHAPRKSSLLRFAQAASPEDVSGGNESEPLNAVPEVTPRARKYKRRSSTYPYQSSERESGADACTNDHVWESMNRLTLDEENSPENSQDLAFPLPPHQSTSTRTSSASSNQFASPPTGNSSEESSIVTFTHPSIAHGRGSSVLWRSYSGDDISSSPPATSTPTRQYLRERQASPELPSRSTTPNAIDNAVVVPRTPRTPRTAPRLHRHQLDGNSFLVYNDSLSTRNQPQTPADLSRQPFITEHAASYTAPPGMVRSAAAPASHRNERSWERDSGEQSPIARAMTLRERRARELTRSVRAEGVRLNRLRMRDEAMFALGTFQPGTATNGGMREGALPQMPDEVWRDDLDADRVGDENFEADPELGGRPVMRAVSGNAHFDM